MKALLAIFIFIFFSACSNEAEQPVVQRDTLPKKDSFAFPTSIPGIWNDRYAWAR